MKKSKVCPKCQSVKIGFLQNEYTHARQQHEYDTPLAPQALPVDAPHTTQRAIAWDASSVVLQGHEDPVNVWNPVGPLEAYICTECGYYESYVKQPEAIGWEACPGFRWVNPDPPADGPYR